MEQKKKKMVQRSSLLNGFAPVSSPPLMWKSRRRSDSKKSAQNATATVDETQNEEKAQQNKEEESPVDENMQEVAPELTERRKALFEPLEPITNINGKRPSAESLLPPPDFETATYPRGWLVGKKRKLVNVDVVESMRRIAVSEMNRKDREINGLNEQLEEDARCLEHLQLQLLHEKSRRSEVERENTMLEDQISMLMNMLQENEETMDDEGTDDQP